MGNDVDLSGAAIADWLEAEATARGESVEDVDASSFGGGVAGEEAAALINAADSEGLFTGPTDLPAISLNAYAHDGGALLLGLRPRPGNSGGSAWAYGQVGSYVVEVADLGFAGADSPRPEEVLRAAAEIASDLIPLYRAVCEACSLAGEIPRDEPSYEQAVGLALRSVRKEKHLSLPDIERITGGEFKPSVLGAYERGQHTISVARLHRLAQIYSVSTGELLRGEALQGPVREGR